MKKLNYWDIKSYASKEDEKACNKCWDDEIKLYVDDFGRVWNEGGVYIADVTLLEENEEY